ncbi:MAG TPA: MglA protein [Myxococcota bacterium]|nr:MglA protein [Myxococcota bacterium]HRY95643.1 MglA protein [Myxococcota bacterium]HSA23617.1 MglA protein [Myxococcota bacterium]
MVQINLEAREITLKIVYYGPALSGKTTNLQAVHQLMDANARGRLMILDTSDDRTLFFDLMPVYFRSRSGFTVKVKLFTVPGQVMHNSTRRIVLQGADGVAFVADSQKEMAQANNDSWRDMQQNLRLNGLDPTTLPIVIQFNKRDMPDVRPDEELDEVARRGREKVFKAVAIRGDGVLETLEGILRMTWRSLDERYQLAEKLGIEEAEFVDNLLRRGGTPPAPGAGPGQPGGGGAP